ncbi:MAG: hypothetical protein AB7V53_05820, partial [Dongiaceae bacterium]
GRADLRDGKAAPDPAAAALRAALGGKRVICLDIPDRCRFMDPALLRLLEARVLRYIPAPQRQSR